MKKYKKLSIISILIICLLSNTSLVFATEGNTYEINEIKRVTKDLGIIEKEYQLDNEFLRYPTFSPLHIINSDNIFLDSKENNEQKEENKQEKKKDVKFKKIPLYNQLNYKKTNYGDYGTVSSHGCGIVCISMVHSYLLDKKVSVKTLAKDYGEYNTINGSLWSLFDDCAKDYGIKKLKQTSDREKIIKALKNNQPVISIQSKGLFTSDGHFIVLTGINKNGKIMVNDPNGKNYNKNKTLKNGFKYGFSKDQVFDNSVQCWIYPPREK